MNILLVTPFALSATGGVTTTIRMLQREFSSRGHTVRILTESDLTRLQRLSSFEGSDVYGAYLRPPFVPEAPAKGFAGFVGKLPFSLWQLHRFLAEHDIDVVNIHYPTSSSLYFTLLRPLSRWRLVATFLGNDVHDLTSVHWSARRITQRLLTAADHIVTVSQSLAQKLRESFRGVRFRHSVIPTGTPVAAGENNLVETPFVPAPYILSAGHLIDRKGFDILLRAAGLAARKGVRLNVAIAGDGPCRDELQQIANREGIAANTFFLGDQSHDAVLALVRNAGVFVLASRAEGLPLVILEAMAAGTPVIATAVDGVPEAIDDGRTGLLVKSEDVEGLADALLRLHGDAELCGDLAGRARERVLREFTWSVVGQKYLDTFQALSGAPPRR